LRKGVVVENLLLIAVLNVGSGGRRGLRGRGKAPIKSVGTVVPTVTFGGLTTTDVGCGRRWDRYADVLRRVDKMRSALALAEPRARAGAGERA
jgi:hypothetical protein